MAIAHQLGIFTYGFFMLGFPTETLEEMRATLDLAMRVKADVVSFFRVIPFRSTELWEWVPEEVRNDPHRFSKVGYVLSDREFNLSEVPSETIGRLQHGAMRRFYLDPRRLLNLFLRHPRRRGLPGYGMFYLQNMFFPQSLSARSLPRYLAETFRGGRGRPGA